MDLLTNGNSYVKIVRNRLGRPIELLPFKYNDIKPILCNKENNFCRNFEILFNSRSEKLDTCRKETYSIDIH